MKPYYKIININYVLSYISQPLKDIISLQHLWSYTSILQTSEVYRNSGIVSRGMH